MPQLSQLHYLGTQEMNGSDDGIEFAGYPLEKVFNRKKGVCLAPVVCEE
jgi:hypothetical protein